MVTYLTREQAVAQIRAGGGITTTAGGIVAGTPTSVSGGGGGGSTPAPQTAGELLDLQRQKESELGRSLTRGEVETLSQGGTISSASTLTPAEQTALVEAEKIKQEWLVTGKALSSQDYRNRLDEAVAKTQVIGMGGGAMALRSAEAKGYRVTTQEVPAQFSQEQKLQIAEAIRRGASVETTREGVKITEQEQKKPLLKFGDISWKETFFPKTSYAGQPTFQLYQEQQFMRFDEFITGKLRGLNEKLPNIVFSPYAEKAGVEKRKIIPEWFIETKVPFSITAFEKGLLFAPMMQTSGRLVSQLPKETSVRFVAKTEIFKEDAVKSQVFFRTDTGRMGKAIGLIKPSMTSEGLLVDKGIVFGKSGELVAKFPTGKFGFVKTKGFFGVETFVSKDAELFYPTQFKGMFIKGDATKQFSRGIVTKGNYQFGKEIPSMVGLKNYEQFGGISISTTKGEFTKVAGRTFLQGGQIIRSAGVIKTPVTPDVGGGFPSYTPQVTKLLKGNLKVIENVIATQAKAPSPIVTKAVTQTTASLVIARTPKRIIQTKTTNILFEQPQTQTQTQKIIQNLGVAQEKPQTQSMRKVLTFLHSPIQTQTIEKTMTTTQVQPQPQTQTKTQIMKQTQKQTQVMQEIFGIPVITRVPIRVPIIPFPFTFPSFGLSEGRIRDKKKKKKPKRGYQPSVSAVQLGIIGKPAKRVTGLEIRGYAPEKGTKSYAKRISKFLMG